MTIAIILALLLVPYGLLKLGEHYVTRGWPGRNLRGRISLALVFLFTGVGHFIKTEPMAEMLPVWVPARITLVYVTGVYELAAAVGLLVPRLRRLTGISLILFLIAAFPANVYSAVERTGLGGHDMGPAYLWVRLPLQLLLIAWTYTFAVRGEVEE